MARDNRRRRCQRKQDETRGARAGTRRDDWGTRYDWTQRISRDCSRTSRATALAAPSTAPATEQVPIPLTTSGRSGPAAGNTMTAELGAGPYVRGYAMVNAHNRHAAFAEVPSRGRCVPTDVSEVELVH